MRVRILQGKETGVVTEVSQTEGENLLTTGFAEPVPDQAPEGASLVDYDEGDTIVTDPAPPSVPPARIRKPRASTPRKATTRRKRR